MKEKGKNFKKTAFGVLLVAFMVSAAIVTTVLTNMQDKPDVENVFEWFKAPMVLGTNNTVGAGTSGIVDIYILNDAFSGWNSPIDEDDANIYEETNGTFVDDETGAPHPNLEGTTPYETDFHICVVYQFTKAQAYDGGAWNASRVKAVMNTSDCQDGNANTVWMVEGSWYAGDDVNTQRINFYLLDIDGGADDGTAFQVAIDSTFTADCKIYYKG